MQEISLYWFVAQQQTSTFRRQNFSLFYLKFSADFNELSLKVTRSDQKMAKTKIGSKNAYRRRSEAKS